MNAKNETRGDAAQTTEATEAATGAATQDATEGGVTVPEGTPSNPFTLDSPEVAGPLAAMIEATEQEAKARDDAAVAVEGAAARTWGVLRTQTLHLLATVGPDLTDAALTAYKGRAAIIGGKTAARAAQYASDLRRAVKLVKAGGVIPERFSAFGRSAWNDAPEFASVKGKTGRAKGQTTGTQAANKADAAGQKAEGDKAPEGQTVAGAAVADAAARATDPVWADVLDLYAKLHGIFRKEAAGRVKGLLLEIEAKQAKAGTGTK